MGHHLLNCKLPRDLGDMGNPLYSVVAEKTGHERPAATAPFDPTSMAAGAPPGDAPAPKITSVGTVQVGGGAPSSDELAWFDGGGRQWQRRLDMRTKHTGRTSICRGVSISS
jgi:hypothetical protein